MGYPRKIRNTVSKEEELWHGVIIEQLYTNMCLERSDAVSRRLTFYSEADANYVQRIFLK